MALKYTSIRPGLLVSLKTSIKGNVSYDKQTIEAEHAEGDALVTSWKTERRIEDAEEHERATKARSKARSLVSSVCTPSSFGLLCPDNKAQELEEAIVEARRVADLFNFDSKRSKIAVYIITGRVAQDDVEAVRAINSEIADLLGSVQDGLKTLNVQGVRDAASRAKSIAQMLPADAQSRVQEAVDTARAVAREIVKAGEQVATEIDQQAIDAIGRARTAFLDIDQPVGEIAAPVGESRAIDFEPEEDPDEVHAAAVRAAEAEGYSDTSSDSGVEEARAAPQVAAQIDLD